VVDYRSDSISLTQLTYALNNSTVNALAFSAAPKGYGTHTKYFILVTDGSMGHNPRPVEIRNVLCMMTNLQVAEIRDVPHRYGKFDVTERNFDGLRTFIHGGWDPSHVLEQRWISHAMPFLQALYITGYASCEQSGSLFIPDLQKIDMPDCLCSVVANWVIPNLKHLDIQLREGYKSLDFMGLLETKGSQILSLSLDIDYAEVPEISEVLSLCTNLFTFNVSLPGEFLLSSLTPHTKLEAMDIGWGWDADGLVTRGTIDYFLGQVDKFISTWRLRFPNLRVAKFQETFHAVRFYTADNFYTIWDDNSDIRITCRRWEGTWVGDGE